MRHHDRQHSSRATGAPPRVDARTVALALVVILGALVPRAAGAEQSGFTGHPLDGIGKEHDGAGRRAGEKDPVARPRAPGPVGQDLLASRANQDGDASAVPPGSVPPGPEKQVRAFLDSEDPEDWVRALTVLNIELRNANSPPAGEDPRPVPDWIGDLLREYLIDRAREIPDRTRRLLRDEILLTPEPGEWVLIAVLSASNQGFRPEIEAVITRIACDRDRRDQLLVKSLKNTTEIPPQLLPRLIPLLAPHEPGVVVGRTIEFFQEHPREDVLRAIEGYLGVKFADGDAMVAWWAENRDRSIHDSILERARAEANQRTLKLWSRANKIIAEGHPAQQRTWLLQSLDPKESPGPVRRRALQEIEKFVARISTGETAVDAETQANLLGLLLQRIQQIISGEVTETESRDSAEYHATRVHAVRALRAMAVFRDDPAVKELLQILIDGLRAEAFDVTTRRGELGLIAIEVVGSLRAPLGALLDDTLADLVGSRESASDWAKVPAEPLRALLGAIAEIGVRPRTVELLRLVLQHRPERSEDVVNALLRPVPKDAAAAALEVLASLVRTENGGAQGENLRTVAIIAIGRLDQPEGIPILVDALRRNGVEVPVAKTALQSILEIGGDPALDALTELLDSPEVAAVLERELLDTGTQLALQDPTFDLLLGFVTDVDGNPRRWLLPVLGREAVAAFLDPARQLADFRTARPEAFERFGFLHELAWSARAGAVFGREDLTALQEGLTRIAEQLPPVIEYLGPIDPGPEGGEPPLTDPLDPTRVVLAAIRDTVTARASLLAALTPGDIPVLLERLGGLLEAEEARKALDERVETPFVGTHRRWLLGILERGGVLEDPTPLLDGLEATAERYPLGEEARVLLSQLRSDTSTPEVPDETPPPSPGDGE